VINYVDRGAISTSVTPLEQEFASPPASTIDQQRLRRRVHGVRIPVRPAGGPFRTAQVLLTAITLFSISVALIPLAGSFAGLLLVRLLLGVGESPAFPAATRVVSRWLPGAERGTALALCVASRSRAACWCPARCSPG